MISACLFSYLPNFSQFQHVVLEFLRPICLAVIMQPSRRHFLWFNASSSAWRLLAGRVVKHVLPIPACPCSAPAVSQHLPCDLALDRVRSLVAHRSPYDTAPENRPPPPWSRKDLHTRLTPSGPFFLARTPRFFFFWPVIGKHHRSLRTSFM